MSRDLSNISVNADQRLYVIRSHGGYSCLGFDVAERKRVAVLEWIGRPYPNAGTYELGTLAHFSAYQTAMDHGAAHAAKTGQRCPAELTPALIGLEGKRVEVTAPDGTRSRFIVGKSTGWMPIHLEIKRRDSTGGGAAYVPEGATVRPV